MFILDTDHLTVIQRQAEPAFSRLNARLHETPASEIVTTIISFEEQMRGWLAVINRFRHAQEEISAYQRLHHLIAFFSAIPTLDFDVNAAEKFTQLRSSGLRIGAMDLKIASIVLAQKATLLSRNLIDFRKVPGLPVEDWTK